MTLRDRVRVPNVRLSGLQAAARRVSRGGAPEPLAIRVIEPILMDQAIAALERGDVEGFLSSAQGNEFWIDLLAANVPLLKELGLYERGLLSALIMSRTNNYAHRHTIPLLIAHAERARLRAATATARVVSVPP